jgi:hypothetical protein
MLAAGYVSCVAIGRQEVRCMDEQATQPYELPVVEDYGDLLELTAASGFTGPEDGGNKLSIHHTAPSSP